MTGEREIRHGLDTLSWYIVLLHHVMGHRAAAIYLGVGIEEGEQQHCLLCRYERGEVTKDQVIAQLGTGHE